MHADSSGAPAASELMWEHPPHLGLVCVSEGPDVRFRTITRTRYLSLDPEQQIAKLQSIYSQNVQTLLRAIEFCREREIHLYRVTSGLFPMSDEEPGNGIVQAMAMELGRFGRLVKRSGIRVVMHPDQFVVLSSMAPSVVAQSMRILAKHGLALDLLKLPRSAWSCMILHGGKADRGDALVQVIRELPPNVRRRLALENDEYAYSAPQILEICRRAKVPMVFDAHHHVIRENLASYEHPSVARMVAAARATWPHPQWQVVHISNGLDSFNDARHSDLITTMPSSYRQAPWIEVEAKAKERAIAALRRQWSGWR